MLKFSLAESCKGKMVTSYRMSYLVFIYVGLEAGVGERYVLISVLIHQPRVLPTMQSQLLQQCITFKIILTFWMLLWLSFSAKPPNCGALRALPLAQ